MREGCRGIGRGSVLLAAGASLLAGAGRARADLTADQTPFNAYRGIWVDRFDYSVANAPSSIAGVMANAKALGFTDVVFQVRGQADAYYWNNGNLEVRASGVTATNDPLAIAIAEGHARGLRVHAWINTMPIWQARQTGTNVADYTPQAPAQHLINQHPEYWIRNADGTPMPFPTGGTGYVIANPANENYRKHVNDVARQITASYAVDGFHLDYIRLYDEEAGATNPLEYPGDAATIAKFQQQHPGQTPITAPAAFKAFMADQITTLVREVRDTVKTARPAAQLTAAVWRDADIGLDSYQQDWARWVDSGLLDAAMPMIYRKGFGSGGAGLDADAGNLFRNNVAEAMSRRGTAGIMVGLGTYLQDNAATAYANTIAQLNYAKEQGANGVQAFDYGTMFNNSAASNEVKRAIGDFFAANTGVAPAQTLAGFDGDEGPFKWAVTQSGSNQNVAPSSTADYDPTAGGRTGPGAQRIVINRGSSGPSFLARHLSGNGASGSSAATFEANTPVASIGSIGFWLKTTTPDLRVSVALDDPTTGDRAYFQNVTPDGQWHRYEWFLADPTHWDQWVTGSDGHLNNVVTLDSIQFAGTADTSTIFLDDVYYNPSAVAANQWTYDTDAGATWSHAGHWTGGAPNAVGATANLLRRATADRAVVLDKPVTLGTLNFDNANGYSISGTSTLSLDVASGSARVNVFNRGTHAVNVPLAVKDHAETFVDRGSRLVLGAPLQIAASRTVTKTGDGVLEISGPQAHGAGAALTAAGGLTRLASDGGANLAVTATGTAHVEFAASQTLRALALGGSAAAAITPGARRTVLTRALTLTGDATLDVGDGGVVVDYPVGTTSPVARVRQRMIDGALRSSLAGPSLAVAYAEAAEVLGLSGSQTGAAFMGRTVDPHALLVRLTLKGDTDLDGSVDFGDLVRVAQSYDSTVSAVTDSWWARGDFTLDGIVDFDDLVALAQNYDAALPAAAAGGAEFTAAFADAWDAARVPEPGGVGAVLAGALALGRRRRSRAR
jgi:uncharacterized lipoprotein YddW (UPF0748 family)